MAKRRIKFIWGGPEQIPGEWKWGIVGAYERDPGSRVKGLAVSARGILRLLGLVAAAGYLAATTALYAWFTRNPYNQVRFVDTLFLPVRWAHVREVRGRMLIEEGLDDLKAQRWAEASMKLHLGLDRAPHDLRARMALAQFSVLANRRPEALKILMADLANGYPGRKYLELLFSIAGEGEDFDVIVATCERFAGAAAADQAWLTVQKVQALMRSGRAEDVAALVDAVGPAADVALKEARVLALLELKQPAAAVEYLERWSGQPGVDQLLINRLLVRAYREAGDTAGMERAWTQFRELSPADPRTYAYGVVQRALGGQTEAAKAALEEYFLRFAGTADNLTLLASALAETKAPALVRRCVEEAAIHGFSLVPLRFSLLQAQLGTGDWVGAGQTLTRLKSKDPRQPLVEKFVIEFTEDLLSVVAHPDGGPQEVLIGFLQQRPVSMRVFRLTLEPLVLAGRFAVAQRVLEVADHAYPGSRTLADLRRQVQEALKPVPVAGAVAAQPVPVLAREKAFFEELEKAQREQRWKAAAEAIREVRVLKPAWLATRENDVLLVQMRVAAQLGDIPELLAAASFYLDGSTQRAVRAFEIAQTLDAAGRRPDAERLMKEILKKNPDFPAITRLLQQWHPPAPKPGLKRL